MMRDTIREIDPEVVDVLRLIINLPATEHDAQPGLRALSERFGERNAKILPIFPQKQVAAAMRATGLTSKKRVEQAVHSLRRISDSCAIVDIILSLGILDDIMEIASFDGWPFLGDVPYSGEFLVAYERGAEALSSFMRTMASSSVFPLLAERWILSVQKQHQACLKQFKTANAKICVIERVLYDGQLRKTMQRIIIEADQSRWFGTAIEDADFSLRTFNCLKKAGLDTLGEVASKTPDELLHPAIHNFGRRCLDEVVKKLTEFGLKLKEPE